VSHTQSVLKLPTGTHCLAFSEKEPVHAFFAEPYAWGIQFHPEFNQDIVKTYINEYKDTLRKEGQNPEKILKSVTETPISSDVLKRFGKIIANH
jgi:GMP synthase (glutamine-hydrolysing)